jgi:hypothetical protein
MKKLANIQKVIGTFTDAGGDSTRYRRTENRLKSKSY